MWKPYLIFIRTDCPPSCNNVLCRLINTPTCTVVKGVQWPALIYIYIYTVRVHGCKAFLSGKNGTISNARKWAGAHVRESKIPAQGLHSTCAGMLAMHKEIGSVPRPDWTRTWFVVDALHHQNI